LHRNDGFVKLRISVPSNVVFSGDGTIVSAVIVGVIIPDVVMELPLLAPFATFGFSFLPGFEIIGILSI
jgi:hypothetical protein